MIRLLVTNGCSCTRGEELIDPQTQAWPVLLAEILGVECVNLARDGSSNRRIVRSTVSQLGEIRTQFALRSEQILLLPVWTQASRHEYFSLHETLEPRHSSPNEELDRHWQSIGPWRSEARHMPSRAFYRHLWSEEGQLANLFLDWVLLDRWAQHEGYQARYAFAFPVPRALPSPASSFLSQLDPETTWGGLPPQEGMSFLEMPSSLARGPGGHPLAEGHAWFAQSLARWLC